MNRRAKMNLTQWEMTKEVINALLGLGYGYRHDDALEFFSEISGDFGVPTERDMEDFIRMASQLPQDDARQATAKKGVDDALRLYSF